MLLKTNTSLKDELKNSKSSKTPSSALKTPSSALKKEQVQSDGELKKTLKSRVTIKYDAGFPNQLYIRGNGANLSWNKGEPLSNVKADEWVWETDAVVMQIEFKILINDRVYENGNNHILNRGSTLFYTPTFY